MVIFNSYVKLPEGSYHKSTINPPKYPSSCCLYTQLVDFRPGPSAMYLAELNQRDGVPWFRFFVEGRAYGIYANIWGILMVNVTIYSIHGSYGEFQSVQKVQIV